MTEAWDRIMEKQRAAGPGILQMVCGMTGAAAFFCELAADGRGRKRDGGERSLGAKRSAVTELTCSHLLYSWKGTSTLSCWGRRISSAVLGGGEAHRAFECSGKVVFVFHAHIGTNFPDCVVCTFK